MLLNRITKKPAKNTINHPHLSLKSLGKNCSIYTNSNKNHAGTGDWVSATYLIEKWHRVSLVRHLTLATSASMEHKDGWTAPLRARAPWASVSGGVAPLKPWWPTAWPAGSRAHPVRRWRPWGAPRHCCWRTWATWGRLRCLWRVGRGWTCCCRCISRGRRRQGRGEGGEVPGVAHDVGGIGSADMEGPPDPDLPHSCHISAAGLAP
jgi:hypothetical protein